MAYPRSAGMPLAKYRAKTYSRARLVCSCKGCSVTMGIRGWFQWLSDGYLVKNIDKLSWHEQKLDIFGSFSPIYSRVDSGALWWHYPPCESPSPVRSWLLFRSPPHFTSFTTSDHHSHHLSPDKLSSNGTVQNHSHFRDSWTLHAFTYWFCSQGS